MSANSDIRMYMLVALQVGGFLAGLPLLKLIWPQGLQLPEDLQSDGTEMHEP